MRRNQKLVVICFVLTLALMSAQSVQAAPFEFSPTTKNAYDQMVSSAVAATAKSLNKEYTDLKLLQQQDTDWDAKISTLYSKNEKDTAALRKQIQELDTEKIKKLEVEVKNTKARFEPVFQLYDSQKKQLSFVKSFKDKDLTKFMNAALSTTNIAVQSAKKTIRAKEASLSEARSSANDKRKRLRAVLAESDPIKAKIKTTKSTISSNKKLFTAETKVLNQLVRKKDAPASLRSLTRMNSLQRQLIASKTTQHGYEQQITATITKAAGQLASMR